MKVLKTIGFVFLLLLLWVLGLLALIILIEDAEKNAIIIILYFVVGIIAIFFATKRFIKNGYYINRSTNKARHITHQSKYGEAAVKLADARLLASKINSSSVDVTAFCRDYNALCECMDRLIWLNEKRHVSMNPRPRANKERIANNLPAAVNAFIDRSVAEIDSTSGYAAVLIWLSDLRLNDDFRAVLSEEVECHIKQLQYRGFDSKIENIKVYDELLPQAVDVVFDIKQASVSMLQRRLKLGYSRAARIVDQMEELGIVGSFNDSTPRTILINKDQWDSIKHNYSFQAVQSADSIDTEQLLEDEHEWRRIQLGVSPEDYELYRIDHMEGHAFEHWCADLLRKNGFANVEVTRASNDQGVDVLAEKDGIKYAVQCKCYSSDLGNTPIQEVNTGKSIYHCHVGAVMTNRHFTAGAKEAAKANNILLWDRDYIAELLKNK